MKSSITFLFLLTAVTSGCAYTYRRGDATFRSYPQFIGREGDRTYTLSLPEVSLAKACKVHFKVRDLKRVGYDYTLVMPLPRLSRRERLDSKGSPPSWSPAVVNIRFLNPDQSLVAERNCDLGASIQKFEWPDDGKWQMSLAGMKGIEALSDFDVEIQVLVPSPDRRDWAQLQALGFDNLLTPDSTFRNYLHHASGLDSGR